MKELLTIIVLIVVVSCSPSEEKKHALNTKIVCGDSIEQEMFDETGNVIFVKVPGKCDTIGVTAED